MSHAIGSKVWVKRDNEEVWAKAEVKGRDNANDHFIVHLETGEELKARPEELPLQNPEVRGVEDMTKLAYLHEPGVLWNLKCRYMCDDIYTYTGSILIAVNPFASLSHLYGTHMMDLYRGQDLGELSPHVYAIADAAYKQMRKDWKGQSILVSGESGAGKTETSKLIMKYLAYMGGYSDSGEASGSGRSVEEQVLESNPLLEAFGNAKTVRNSNSSRFGKYVEINFNKQGVISGAAIRTYLLERSRVVAVNDPERNYHIFYQLCEGASPEERERWQLVPAQEFHYLNQSSCFELPGVNNAEEFKCTIRAMSRVGIPDDDREAIFRTVAAILHLGNVSFKAGPTDNSVPADDRSQRHLASCASLLGVEQAGLLHALTTRTRMTPDGPITSPLEFKQSTENRDSLAKMIYSKMFDWLVARINAAIGEDKNCASSVGVLDIYGFESFAVNDFEQFCINLANEKLQQHFNQHVFKMEQAEYEREKIDWSYIQFVDNQDVLDLIEGKLGILSLIDEQCRFPSSTAADLAQKLYSTGTCKDSKRFSKPKRSQTAFTIDHYAGDVTYETTHFLDKNKDYVVAEHQNLLGASSLSFMSELFTEKQEEGEPTPASGGKPGGAKGSSFKFNSVGSQFKKQLAELMSALQVMEPHYIRCIKPNSKNQPMIFENANALQQLRCGGVLEAVRISCAGFPSKRPYPDFVDHFWMLAPDLIRDETVDDKEMSRRIVERAGLDKLMYQLGETKVFLKAGGMAILDKLRTEKINRAAVCVQKRVRGVLARLHYSALKVAALQLQRATRDYQARRVVQELRKQNAALLIQTEYRAFQARTQYQQAKYFIERVQSIWRQRNARSNLDRLRQIDAATSIQAHWRAYKARKSLLEQKAAATTLQNAFRCKRAVHELRQYRKEARESTKLLEDKKALEQKVVDLQATLETVQNQRNEMRSQMKEDKAARAGLESQLADVIAQRDQLAAEVSSAIKANEMQAVTEAKAAMEKELEDMKAQMAAAAEAAAKKQAELEKKLNTAQEYIQRQLVERQELERRYTGMKDDLITRLQNACGQRDESRAQVLELQNEIEKMKEVLASKDAQVVQLSAAAAAATAAGPVAGSPAAGAAAANGTTAVLSPAGLSTAMSSVQRALPGYAANVKSMYQNITSTMGLAGAPNTPPGHGHEDGRAPGAPGTAAESEVERKARELQARQQAIAQERRRLEEERLLSALQQPLGFHKGRPVAALLVFRSCLQWRTFQAERTTLFDRTIAMVGQQLEKHQQQDDVNMMAYWLTNTVTLLHLLHKNIKPANNAKARPAASNATRLFSNMFGRSTSGLAHAEASIHGGGVGGFKAVEAKYPALLFKQQVDAIVQKVFPMIRDYMKKQITPLIANCIHTPKGLTASASRRVAHPDAAGNQAVAARSWQEILGCFDQLLKVLKDNFVPKALIQALFKQLFSFVNVSLFNQLLLRRECCSFSNGEYVKTGLAQVENWIQQAGADNVADSWEELKYIRQAVTFLVIGNKPKKSLEEITQDLCPVLSIQQLYRISTMYWDDKYNTETVSGEVLAEMKKRMVESNQTASHSFLLDDDSTLPFSAQEVLANVDDKDLFHGVPVPDALKTAAGGDGGADGAPGAGSPIIGPASFAFLEKELRLAPGGSAGMMS